MIRKLTAFIPSFTLALTLALPCAAPALAMTVLKQIKVRDGKHFKLFFNGVVSQDQIDTEYLNNVIQITLKGASIYPAKIMPLEQGPATKIFVYQYSPRIVRCRFTVKGKAENYKGKIRIRPEGKSISVGFEGVPGGADPVKSTTDTVVSTRSAEERSRTNSTTNSQSDPQIGSDEKALYEKVIHSARNGSVKTGVEKGEASEEVPISTQPPKPASRGLSSLGGILLKLGGILLLFLGFAVALKKLRSSAPSETKGLLNAIGKFARGTLGRDEKLIHVVSTHYLDPKKRIVVVRVAGRLLVLGIANESINLIAQLSDEASRQELDTAFSDVLFAESEKPPLPGADPVALSPGARSRIRSRLEGLKPL